MKETNLHNIVGIVNPSTHKYLPSGRTPESGTQYNYSGQVANATTVIHTVGANKIFLLTDYKVEWVIATVSLIDIRVRNGAAAVQYRLQQVARTDDDSGTLNMNMASAIEIPENWDIAAYSFNGNGTIWYYIHGWEIDA